METSAEDLTVDVVRRRIDRLKDEVIEELEAIEDKLPWYYQAAIWGGGTLALIGAIAGCLAISGATGPAYALAVAVCIAGVIGLIIDIILGLIVYIDESGEADEVDKKKLRLDELTETLEEMQDVLKETE